MGPVPLSSKVFLPSWRLKKQTNKEKQNKAKNQEHLKAEEFANP